MQHLPSPPSTSHRVEKENKRMLSSNSRVSWSQEDKIHSIPSSLSFLNVKSSASCAPPAKSILRKSTNFVLTDLSSRIEREVTPEPSSPLSNASYLVGPVSRIVPLHASLQNLILAYNVLAARIRAAATTETTTIDASAPLFQPLKDNAEGFANAVIRDLGQVMIKPIETQEPEVKSSLPSPRPSPCKKKRGMNEEQAKYARDLSTVTHSVIKLLALLFSSSTVCQLFSHDQLSSVLTALLVIPMADELPTPNARKTCALSIWLLQVQRLPATVIVPAKDRIAYAFRRGIEGELGKEGKKGSASDALQAVHDLSIHEPSIFVSVFTDMLASILSKVLAPTLPLRIQACLALGGFVIGLTSLPRSYLHTRVSNAVADYLLDPSIASKKSFSHESVIVRTLRTLLNNQEPVHPAQGPVWALSVMACFLVMLGPRAYTDKRLSRVFIAQSSLAMRHKKSSVRAMGCLLWRCISWVYFQPPLIAKDPDAVEDDEWEEEPSCSSREQDSQTLCSQRQNWWKLVHSVVDMGAGLSTILGLLAELRSPSSSSSSEGLAAIIKTLSLMVKRGGSTCVEALQIIKGLVPDTSEESVEQDSLGEVDECDWATLVPREFFFSFSGLLTVDFKVLSAVVRPIFDDGPAVEEIRSLTQEELAENDVFKGLIRVWKDSLKALEIQGRAAPPQDMLDIWELLLKAKLEQVKDSDKDSRIFADQVSTLLETIVSDEAIRPSPDSNCDSDDLPSPTSSPIKPVSSKLAPRSNSALRLFLVRYLWKSVQSKLPEELTLIICVSFLGYLKEHHDSLVPITDLHPEGEGDTRYEWGTLCAEILINCQVSSIEKFLGSAKIFRHDLDQMKRWVKDMRGLAWRSYVVKWMEVEEDWEEGISVLLLPIASGDEPWTMTDDDIKTWEILLSYTLSKSLDDSVEPHSVLEQIANQISRYYKPTWTSATRIVDLIISDLDVANYKDVPLGVMELANDTLISSYPPEPRNKVLSSWLIRSITRVVDECPPSLVSQVLAYIQEGLSLWISDEYKSFTPAEYEFDMVISYQTALFAIQNQDQSSELVETFAEIIGSAFRGRPDKPNAVTEAFQEFWMSGYVEANGPENGWPPPVQVALQASALWHDTINVDRDPPEDADNSLIDKDFIINLAQEVLGQPETQAPIIPSTEIAVVSSDLISHHPEEIKKPPIPITPQSCRHTTPSTPNLHKFNSSPPRLTNTGDGSPLMDLNRVPVLSFYSLPTNRKKGDKENVQPVAIDSPHALILGKRKQENAMDDSVVYVKRKTSDGSQMPVHREQHGTMGDTITKPTPHDYLEGNMAQDTRSPIPVKPTVVSKKRKVEYFLAVEVPTYRQVLKARRHTSENLSSSSTTSHSPASLRRTRSVTKLLGESTGYYQDDLPRKKPRVTLDDNSDSSESETPLHDIQIVGSDDSIVLANSVADDHPPSDDDPVNLGNVTPHLMVSPSLSSKRVHNQRWDESDPPSDDSVSGPDSPSKQLVERRQQRFWNVGNSSTLVL